MTDASAKEVLVIEAAVTQWQLKVGTAVGT